MPAAALLDIRNATLWRGDTRVFDRLNLRIDQGEQVAILGPNGAGKTTLLRALNREIYPVADPHSHFRILGRDRWNVWELRRHIGVVSQDLQQRYLPTATAHDVALSGFFASIGVHGTLAARVTAAQHAKARAVLDAAGLAGHGDTPLKRLSTGEQRRCLLARALVHDPHTLVLDEPTAGLDLAGSFEYFDRLAALARRGCSLVLVTHHLNEIPPELDRVILLHEGRIVADGPKFEVLRPEILAPVYGVNLRIARIAGHYLAYPAARESRKRDL